MPVGAEGKRVDDCVAENRRVFGIMGDWSTAVLDPEVWFNTLCEGGYSRVGNKRKMCPEPNRGRERQKRRTRLRLHLA